MPPHNPSVVVVIAAYNEASVIADVVADVVEAGYRVVVVDDGSRDGTGPLARAAGATVVTHPINLGQGAALQTGFDWALAHDADAVVTFDADGQHRVADIARLVDTLRSRAVDYALGSRFLGSTVALPTSRRLLLAAATTFTRITTGLAVTDTHNGLRAMTRRGAARLRLRQNRMAHASEILHQIARSGLPWTETPVTIEYSAYSLAKGQRMGDALTILVDLFAHRMHR
ncbi:glycosyltransferase family 2 protein [Rhodoplanes serenus]|uniref:glycosyltransferase family 2 protein n=1 Tax=Rhodoplanes serenus TaxID=200615 RepID=UPI000DAC18D2|nr:glycosyltransferase family 2 protein [Rhodoplanes serenus]RAI34156.1 cell wall biosynthesis glycosyltransferase [Rhodoplanes serenus]